jgi:hypothetical protein
MVIDPVKVFTALALIGMLAWIAYAVVAGRYLEAVAVSCIGPLLLWFMTGAGKASGGRDDGD